MRPRRRRFKRARKNFSDLLAFAGISTKTIAAIGRTRIGNGYDGASQPVLDALPYSAEAVDSVKRFRDQGGNFGDFLDALLVKLREQAR